MSSARHCEHGPDTAAIPKNRRMPLNLLMCGDAVIEERFSARGSMRTTHPAGLSDEVWAHLLDLKRDLMAALPSDVQDVILFGSRARGDADPDSDFDVAVLLSADLAED
jgi:hypothetical protein